MTNQIKSVGMVGLGQMGHPMAKLIAEKGYNLVGFDPLKKACDAAADNGVEILASPREVAQKSDLVIVIVGFDHQVEALIFEEQGLIHGAKPGLTIAIASTINPTYCRELAQRLEAHGVTLLDIPITRGEPAALRGELLILGAGEETAFMRCKPVFECFASDIFYLGAAGAGQVGKMVNNLILWACFTASDEGLRLGEALGVDPDTLREALHYSSAQNWAMDVRVENTRMPWAEKDMMIALSEADQVRLSLPVCGTVKEAVKGYKILHDMSMPVG